MDLALLAMGPSAAAMATCGAAANGGRRHTQRRQCRAVCGWGRQAGGPTTVHQVSNKALMPTKNEAAGKLEPKQAGRPAQTGCLQPARLLLRVSESLVQGLEGWQSLQEALV